MKIINLGRGQGKTMRLLYASEFQDLPILCATQTQKDWLITRAKELKLQIPEPICVNELIYKTKGSQITDGILVDEAPRVLEELLPHLGIKGEVKAITLTSDELKQELKR